MLGISASIGAPARSGMGWLGDLLDKRRLVMGLLLALSVSVLLMGYTAHAIVFTTCMIIYSLAYGGLADLLFSGDGAAAAPRPVGGFGRRVVG